MNEISVKPSVRIPPRESPAPQGVPVSVPEKPAAEEPAFALIDLPDEPGAPVESSPVTYTVPRDEIRALFRQMRRIGAGEFDPVRRFRLQAQFMKDFTDDYDLPAPCNAAPSYLILGYEELRAYFTWRTRARRGEFPQTSHAYVLLYLTELFNLVGAENGRDALERAAEVWQRYRGDNPVFDRHVPDWLRDCHVYYGMEAEFPDFARRHGIVGRFPGIFVYSCTADDCLDVFSSLSHEDCLGRLDDKERQVAGLVLFRVIGELREISKKHGAALEDSLFYSTGAVYWKPFTGVVFDPVIKHRDGEVRLSDGERYLCKDGSWQCRRVIPTSAGRSLVTSLFRLILACVRPAKRRKPPGKSMTTRFHGADLESLVIAVHKEVAAEMNRVRVRVSPRSLLKIREESLITQERLLADGEPAEPQATAPVPEKPAARKDPGDVWTAFRDSLTAEESGAVRAALRGDGFRAAAEAAGTMPEILADTINQKAMDTLGDVILDVGEPVAVYEEYAENLAEVINF